MNILLDADALIALAKTDDNNHQKAIKISHSIKKDNLFVSPFTIPEAATVLSYRVSQEAARPFLKEIRNKTLLEVSLDKGLEKLADEIFLEQKSKEISWADCLNVAIYKKYKMDGIFSFDSFYRKEGLTIIK